MELHTCLAEGTSPWRRTAQEFGTGLVLKSGSAWWGKSPRASICKLKKKKRECEKVVLVGSKAFEPPLCLWQRSGQPLSGPGHLGRTRQRHEALVIFLMNVADPFVQLEAHKLTFFFNAFGFYQLCLLWVLGICPFTVWIKWNHTIPYHAKKCVHFFAFLCK